MAEFSTSNDSPFNVTDDMSRVTAKIKITKPGETSIERSATVFAPVDSEYEDLRNFHNEIDEVILTLSRDTSVDPIWDEPGAMSESEYPVIDFEGRKFARTYADWIQAQDDVLNGIDPVAPWGSNKPSLGYPRFGPCRMKIKNATVRGGVLMNQGWESVPDPNDSGTNIWRTDADVNWISDSRITMIDDDIPESDPVASIYPFFVDTGDSEVNNIIQKFRYNYSEAHWIRIDKQSEGESYGRIHTKFGDEAPFGIDPVVRGWKLYDTHGFTNGIEVPFGQNADGNDVTETMYGVRFYDELIEENGGDAAEPFLLQAAGFISDGIVGEFPVTDSPSGETIDEHRLKPAFIFRKSDRCDYTDYHVQTDTRGREPTYEKFIEVYKDGFIYTQMVHTSKSSSLNSVKADPVSNPLKVIKESETHVMVSFENLPESNFSDGVEYVPYPRQRDYLKGKSMTTTLAGTYFSRPTILGFTVSDPDRRQLIEDALGADDFTYNVETGEGRKETIISHADANVVGSAVIVEYSRNKIWSDGNIYGDYVKIDNTLNDYGKSFFRFEDDPTTPEDEYDPDITTSGGMQYNGYYEFLFVGPNKIPLEEGEFRFDITDKKLYYRPKHGNTPNKVIISMGRVTVARVTDNSDFILENCNLALGSFAIVNAGGAHARCQFRNCYARNAGNLQHGGVVYFDDSIAENMVFRGLAVTDGSKIRRSMILNAQNQSGCLLQCLDDNDPIRESEIRDSFFYMGATTHGQGFSAYKNSYLKCAIQHNIFYDCKRSHSAQPGSQANANAERGTYLLDNNLFWLDRLIFPASAGQKHISHQTGDGEQDISSHPPSPADPEPNVVEYGDQVEQMIISRNTLLYNTKWITDPTLVNGENYGQDLPNFFGLGIDRNVNSRVWLSNTISPFFNVPNTFTIVDERENDADFPLGWNGGIDAAGCWIQDDTKYNVGGSTGTSLIENWVDTFPVDEVLPHDTSTSGEAIATDGGRSGIRWQNVWEVEGTTSILNRDEIKRIFEEKDRLWFEKYPVEAGLTEPLKQRNSAAGPYYPCDLFADSSSGGGGGGSTTLPGEYVWTDSQSSWNGTPLLEDGTDSPGEFWDSMVPGKFWSREAGASGRGLVLPFSDSTSKDQYLSYVNDDEGNQIRKVKIHFDIVNPPETSVYIAGERVTIIWPDDASTYGLGSIRRATDTSVIHDRVSSGQDLWPFSGDSGDPEWPGEKVIVSMEWEEITP